MQLRLCRLPIAGGTFAPQLFTTCLSLFCGIIMLQLAAWQQHRGEYKQSIIASYIKHSTEEASVPTIPALQQQNIPRYTKITVRGKFLSHKHLLLDNQQQQNTPGFHVISPFKLENSSVILWVNRGFMARPDHRLAHIPQELDYPEEIALTGALDYPPKTLLLGQNTEYNADGTMLIQSLAALDASTWFQEILLDYILVADTGAQAFSRIRKPTEYLTPERHFGYALQWKVMALTLLLLFLGLNWKKME